MSNPTSAPMQMFSDCLIQMGLLKPDDAPWKVQAYLGIVVVLIAGSQLALNFLRPSSSSPRKVLALSKDWQEFPLVRKDALSHNTALYRFALPKKTDVLGLPIGQHISVQAEIDGKVVTRSYTPTTLDSDSPGHVDLVVKTYEKGNISRYLSLLTIGQKVKIKGPKGKFHYTSTLSPHLLMIAGGTGITPMYQIIKASVADPKDTTELRLIYGNVEENDILLRDELKQLEEASNGRLKVYHVLNKAPEGWSQGQGFISKAQIEAYMHANGVGHKDSKVLMCGPPPMIGAMKGHLAAIGYPAPNTISKLEDQVFCF